MLGWWLASGVLGWIAAPLTWRLFSRLPDRGQGFSRPLGLLFVGYLLWLGSTLRILRNDLGGVLGAVIVLGVLSYVAVSGRWAEFTRWIRDRRPTLLAMEFVFLALFASWAFVRANNPEIVATEKPMELAFLNSIVRSEYFPPLDPWLSGFAISYYYFGYVLLSTMTLLTGVSTGVAFNLGISLWFGMTGLGAFALLYNLLTIRGGSPNLRGALLGPIFVLITGNLEGFLDALHSRHLFWRQLPNGQFVSEFWRWLDLKDLVNPPAGAPTWIPERYLWWWRASRVVRDVNLGGFDVEVIDEFPFFSFLLADNHPHVLVLPFVLAALALALNVFLGRDTESLSYVTLADLRARSGQFFAWGLVGLVGVIGLRVGIGLAGGEAASTALAAGLRIGLLLPAAALVLAVVALASFGRLPTAVSRSEFWSSAWLFGGLAFLNTWDFPIYLTILLAAVWWRMRLRSVREQAQILTVTAIAIGGAGILLYLPWYPSFASQAGGVLPNLAYPSRLTHLFIMFGPLIVPIVFWLTLRLSEGWKREEGRRFLGLALGIPAGLFLLSVLLAGGALLLYAGRDPLWLETVLNSLGAADLRAAINEIGSRRLTRSWSALALGAVFAASALLLFRRRGTASISIGEGEKQDDPSAFILILIGVGALLVLGPEFVYLRDLFGTRMNTVFKFFYATWILWGVAAAYVTVEIWPERWSPAAALRLVAVIPLLLGLVYPILAIGTKTDGFQPAQGRTLDGTRHLSQSSPGDYAAIQWIAQNLQTGVIAEAVGGSYTEYGRVATHTGLPTVLGWEFHEVQWRGSAEEQGSRKEDVRRLYQTRSWEEANDILRKYGISYVYVGPLERREYTPLNETKFEVGLEIVYRDQEVTIYATPGASGVR